MVDLLVRYYPAYPVHPVKKKFKRKGAEAQRRGGLQTEAPLLLILILVLFFSSNFPNASS